MAHDADDALNNPAHLDDEPPVAADQDLSCDDYLVFAMKDKCHRFTMGLGTILECVRIAEQEGAVPPMPTDWWLKVEARYPGCSPSLEAESTE